MDGCNDGRCSGQLANPCPKEPPSKRQKKPWSSSKTPPGSNSRVPPKLALIPAGKTAYRCSFITSDRERQKFDALSRKVYSAAAFNLHIINYGAYQFFWEKIATYIGLLSEDKWPLAKLLQAEALCLSKWQINVSRLFPNSSLGPEGPAHPCR